MRFGVWGLGPGVGGLGFGVENLGFRVQGSGFGVWDCLMLWRFSMYFSNGFVVARLVWG